MRGILNPTRRRTLTLIAAATTAPATTGCLGTAGRTNESHGDDENENENENENGSNPNDADDAETQPHEGDPLRGFNFIPDAGGVDFYINDTVLIPDVGVIEQGTAVRFVEGESEAHITRAGDAHTTPLATTTVGEGPQTLVALGEICRRGPGADLIAVEDDFSRLSPRNTRARARVRVIHASPDTPPFDIEVDGGGGTPYQALAFGEAQYAEVPAGERVFTVRDGDTGEKIAAFEFELPAGHVCTAFAIGYQNPAAAPAPVPADFSFAMGIVDDGPVANESE